MLWTIIGILIVLWILGLITKVAGGLIHILLVIALIVFIFNMISKRRAG
ncbi:lmo0937 family membrane protein [Bacillus sp. FSL K6-3431]